MFIIFSQKKEQKQFFLLLFLYSPVLVSDFSVQQLVVLHPVRNINDIIIVIVAPDDNLADAGIDNLPLPR